MCWQCDHPGATWQDYLAHLRELLARHCWVVQGVQRQRHRAPYAYTIGLASHDQPELVVTGLPYDQAADLLNGLAGLVLAGGRCLRPGELVPLPGGRRRRSCGSPSPPCTWRWRRRSTGPGSRRCSWSTPTIGAAGRGRPASAAGGAGSRSSVAALWPPLARQPLRVRIPRA